METPEVLKVTVHDDGSYTFEWDPNSPEGAYFNEWTEQDFIDAISRIAKSEEV